MSFIVNLHRVSEFLFLLLGSLFLTAFLFWQNNFYPHYSEIFLRLADLPLILFTITYGLTSLRVSLTHQYFGAEKLEHDQAHFPVGDTILLLLGLVIFLTIAYVDIMVDSILPFPGRLL